MSWEVALGGVLVCFLRGLPRENRWGDRNPSIRVTTMITAGLGVKGVGLCRSVCGCATWFLGTQNSRFPGPEAPKAHSSHGGLSPKYLTGGLWGSPHIPSMHRQATVL